ncbi:hypothetical protein P4H67_02960 [Paenibacillus lautus]|uniref:hypothetical protein n=1 Tax=Paenibacillus lautus TaxID=1401 RepID=UPI002DBD017C|nr:hypothetical protein [Paenibacillus lautus]MEC0305727.1 hypothetical protein [Paenibacillus lautus]
MSKKFIFIVLFFCILPLTTSCNSSEEVKPPAKEEQIKPEFKIQLQDVATVVIVGSQGNRSEITDPDDIRLFINLINSDYQAESPGAVNDVGYREVIISMKDGKEINLIFGGNGHYFVVSETNFAYFLKPNQSTNELRDLVERTEKENK